ncbi:hypothetical protein L9F63_020350, partial [Diploptera punctata]
QESHTFLWLTLILRFYVNIMYSNKRKESDTSTGKSKSIPDVLLSNFNKPYITYLMIFLSLCPPQVTHQVARLHTNVLQWNDILPFSISLIFNSPCSTFTDFSEIFTINLGWVEKEEVLISTVFPNQTYCGECHLCCVVVTMEPYSNEEYVDMICISCT